MAIKFNRGKVLTLSYPWLCDASGDVTITIPNFAGYSITAFETSPGLNGDLATTLPTNLYDIVLNDEFSCDIAATVLGDRSGTVAEFIVNTVAIPILGSLSAVVSNAGDAKTGLLLLFLERKSH